MKPDRYRVLSRSLSQIENRESGSIGLLKKLYAQKKETPILGITGLPGSGKSTLVDALIALLRCQKKTVGVLAIDPSSPFSGGALLGDRVRMQRHAIDKGVFIRSVGSRGAHGGLSHTTADLLVCLDAFGFDQLILETVGVGQTELDVMGLATTTVVVLVPESGDAIQTIKAGLTEIADIFVVNKKDRDGSEGLKRMLEAMVSMNQGTSRWISPVLLTQANQGLGVKELWQTVLEHRRTLKKNPESEKRRQQLRREQFLELCGEAFKRKLESRLATSDKLKDLIDQVVANRLNPYEALERILKKGLAG